MITDYEISYTMADGCMAESLRSTAIVTGNLITYWFVL